MLWTDRASTSSSIPPARQIASRPRTRRRRRASFLPSSRTTLGNTRKPRNGAPWVTGARNVLAAALAGVVCGTLLAAGLTLAGYGKVAGIHAGLLGALLNAAVAVLGSLAARRSAS